MIAPDLPPSPATQQELRLREHLARIHARDGSALGQLYDETSRYLFGLALRIVGDPADAEEVVLDIYQRVWNSAAVYQEERGTVVGWLLAMTRNRAIDRQRSSSARRNREYGMDGALETPDANPAPEAETLFREERTLIRRALRSLAPEQREAIEMAFFEGLSHSQVAESLGIPLGTIKTRIRMGMKKLRQVLAVTRPSREVPNG